MYDPDAATAEPRPRKPAELPPSVGRFVSDALLSIAETAAAACPAIDHWLSEGQPLKAAKVVKAAVKVELCKFAAWRIRQGLNEAFADAVDAACAVACRFLAGLHQVDEPNGG